MTTTILAFIPSPSQGVWHLGFIPIRAYALCIIAGIVAALVLGDRRWEARGGERGVIYDIALWAVPFGLVGGRLYHVMTDWQKYFGADGAGFLAALRIWDGGLGIWGAVALGGVGAWIACRRRGIPLPAFGDAVAPGIILAQAIGRLGNYFNQELYGRATDLPWGLAIYQRLDPSGVVSPHSLDGVSTGQVYAVVHPTFLYELLWNLLVFAVLLWADRRFKLGHGRLFALYVAGYCVGRFWVELMRSDTATLIAGIRVNSFTSTFVFIGAVIYIMVAAKGRDEPETLRGKDVDQPRLDTAGEELVAAGATSGVVAAATVAGDEDKPEPEPESVFTGGADVESEAAAEGEDLTAQVQTAPSEDIAEGEAFAAEGAAADQEREASLGSVDGGEVEAAQSDAAEVHDAAVEGAESAEGTAGDEVVEREAGLGSVEGGEVEAAHADTAEVHDAAVEGAESAEGTAGESVGREAGLGSVEGGEVEAAQSDAAEVRDAALEGTDSAEGTSDEVAAEEPAGDESPAPPEDGLETVEGGAAAVGTESVSAAEPEDGLGSVEGSEVEAAHADAAEVHDAAAEGAESAEGTAGEVAAEESAGDEPAVPPEDGLGSVEGGAVEAPHADAAEVHDAAVKGAQSPEEPAGDEPAAPPEDGLGSVDGGEVGAAHADAAEVHDAAAEGTESAEGAAHDVAAEHPVEDDSAAPLGDDPESVEAEKPRAEPASTPQRRWWRRG